MPSSLTEVLPSTSVCSTSPPVSVCGTDATSLARGFSRQCGLNPCGSALRPPLSITPQVCARTDLPIPAPSRFGGSLPTPGPTPLRPPFAHSGASRDGTLDPLSIAYGFRPRLRPASPAADQHRRGTLGHPVGGIRTPLALLMPTFALPAAPGVAPARPSPLTGTLPYHDLAAIRGFGARLEPRWIVGAAARSTSELLRTLSRMAASKPTSWLSPRRDGLAH